MHDFTPVHAFIGGALIAASLALNLLMTGRIAGASGVYSGLLKPGGDIAWRVWFILGMLGVGALFELAAPETFDPGPRIPLWLVAVSGVLVGVGTCASNGCTTGHGFCGMSRGSRRSIIATATFCAAAVVTATIVGTIGRHS